MQQQQQQGKAGMSTKAMQMQTQMAPEEVSVSQPLTKGLEPYRPSMLQVFAAVTDDTPYIAPWKPQDAQQVRGSMFIITEDGRALTNFHVIQNIASDPSGNLRGYVQREVRGQKQNISFKIFSVAPDADLAVVQLNPKILQGDTPLKPVKWVSDLLVPPGVTTVALDFPLGGGAKMTVGTLAGNENRVLQTTTLVQRGSSGCPLFVEMRTSSGESEPRVVGVISSGRPSNPGTNYAIPSMVVLALLPSMLLNNTIPYSIVNNGSFGVDFVAANQSMLVSDNFDFRSDVRTKSKGTTTLQSQTAGFRGGLKVTRRQHGNAYYEKDDLREGDILYEVILPDIMSAPKSTGPQVHPTDVAKINNLVKEYGRLIQAEKEKEKGKEKDKKVSESTLKLRIDEETESEEVARLFGRSSETASGTSTTTTVSQAPQLSVRSTSTPSTSSVSSTPSSVLSPEGCVVIQPTTFFRYKKDSTQKEKEKTNEKRSSHYYFPFPYTSQQSTKSASLSLSWINPGDDTVSIYQQSQSDGSWKPAEIPGVATRNFSFDDFMSRVPIGTPLTMYVWRDGKTKVCIQRLHEAFEEGAKGVKFYYSLPSREEDNYILLNGLGLMDLNANQIGDCLTDLRRLGSCYSLLPYLDPKDKKYESAVIITDLLDPSRIDRKEKRQSVHQYDLLTSMDVKFAKIDPSSKKIRYSKEMGSIPIRSVVDLKEALKKLASETVKTYRETILPNIEEYKKFLFEAFYPIENTYTETRDNSKITSQDIVSENWDSLAFVSLNFKDEHSTFFFPKVLRQDTELLMQTQDKQSKWMLKLKAWIDQELNKASSAFGYRPKVEEELVIDLDAPTLAPPKTPTPPIPKPAITSTPNSTPTSSSSSGPPSFSSSQGAPQLSTLVPLRFSPETTHPASLSSLSVPLFSQGFLKPLATVPQVCPHGSHYAMRDNGSQTPKNPPEKAGSLNPASIITFTPCSQCSGGF